MFGFHGAATVYSTDWNRRHAALWSWLKGISELDTYSQSTASGYANGISPDGRVVVGHVTTDKGDHGYEHAACAWEVGGGIKILPRQNEQQDSFARDASFNGKIVVGDLYDRHKGDRQACYWRDMTTLHLLENLPGHKGSTATGMSDNGRVIVGNSWADYDFPDTGMLAVLWSQGGIRSLGVLPGEDYSMATAVSPNGRFVVGISGTDEYTHRAFRWGARDGLKSLDSYLNLRSCEPYAVTSGGRVAVGACWDVWANNEQGVPQQAVLWIDGGVYNLKDYLLMEHGISTDGWELNKATAISLHGKVIAGWGTNPDGLREGWIAELPSPLCREALQTGVKALLTARP